MRREIFNDLLSQNILTCSFSFNEINEKNISYRLNDKTASIGFIYRHIGETMLMFGFFFGMPSNIQNTTMGKQDEGQGNNVNETVLIIKLGYEMLQEIIDKTSGDEWLETVNTPFFGTVSKVRLFSHILYHNAYHAGQIGLTLKKANQRY